MKFAKYIVGAFVLLMLLPALTTSCVKEEEWQEGDVLPLSFSADTVSFDTVFTTMGSTTLQLKVYNTSEQSITLNSVTLRGGFSSRFRLNVDGDTSMVARNVRIAGGDSIFIFVQVNVNPNSSSEPFLIEDAILFSAGGSEAQVMLNAYGRNAVYHMPQHRLVNTEGTPYVDEYGHYYEYSVIDCEHWDHSRPHVIYGYAVVDEGSTLNLNAGDELYFADCAVLWVYEGASIQAQGRAYAPVLFTSLRQDGYYNYLPGQWGHVWLSGGCNQCQFDWCIIENGCQGVIVDTCSGMTPTMVMSNSIVRNMTYFGILGEAEANIDGQNLLVYDCGEESVAMMYGGKCNFRNCTFADYWRYTTRKHPSVRLNNWYAYLDGDDTIISVRNLKDVRFQDCIIYGSYALEYGGELWLDRYPEGQFNVNMTHCLLRGDSAASVQTSGFTAVNCRWNQDPMFADIDNDDYHLQEDSPFLEYGAPQSVLDMNRPPAEEKALWAYRPPKSQHNKHLGNRLFKKTPHLKLPSKH